MVDRRRYQTVAFDSARWDGFPFRDGDIVISTPPKCGTTWTQMLCALLVFRTDRFDRPLWAISPWLDGLTADRDAVVAELEAQSHRRVIKSHTPLDGLPFDDRVTYVCVGRDPRDAALSMDNHVANMRPEVVAGMAARSAASAGVPAPGPGAFAPSGDLRERFWAWMTRDDGWGPTTLPGGLRSHVEHLVTFWERRHEPNVVLLRYEDLRADLPGGLRQLAAALAVDIDDAEVGRLAEAATFDRMRDRADELAPEVGIELWKDNRRFFHKGSSGQWRDLLDGEDLHRYRARVTELAPPDLLAWAHTDWP